MLIRKETLHRNVALGTFGELLIVFSTELNLLFILMILRCCLLHLIKIDFCQVSSLYLLSPFITILKLHSILLTLKMVRNITDLESCKTSGPGPVFWRWF